MSLFFGIACLVFCGVVAMTYSPLIALLALVPALVFLNRSRQNITIMVVNKKGFYYYGQLLTDWDHFISAKFIDEVPVVGYSTNPLSDQFFLMLKYFKEGEPGHFGRKIRLTPNQDKAEEEIMAAIRFYYRHYQETTASQA